MKAASIVVLSKLQQKRLFVKTRRRSVHKGSRRSGKAGASLEFSDFRSYQPGDDIRLIDWNIYGRTGKHYIKRFLDEQEIHAAIFLDATPSMQAIESKWQQAKEIAAAMSFIILNGEDRLTFYPVAANSSGKIARKGTIYARSVYASVLALNKSNNAGGFSELIVQESLKNIQAAILISDGLESLSAFEGLFRKFAGARIEVKFIQVLSQAELEPQMGGDVQLVDSETGTTVNVTMQEAVVRLYQSRLAKHNESLESLCRKFGFTYVPVSDTHDLQNFLFHKCTAKKVLE
ncbi:hypothetical protein AM500_15355 [Bacillus sp. FJAT-18017]|uniref:DUF58 domain-containing protein n=1 Tax=Bacillus sp. FJAT-18017 TaxID=1705566 RepID=UPI0006AF419A|nr:DUF58 domain-containing protein [Bacillus sp. FJAT-18017]ALC91010.1 hypothetical protein AM500_15355 [Bacillus sp. FJAT-18017]